MRDKLSKMYHIETAARMLGVSDWAMRRDVKAGKIGCVRRGRSLYIPFEEIRRVKLEAGRKLDAANRLILDRTGGRRPYIRKAVALCRSVTAPIPASWPAPEYFNDLNP